MNANIGSLLGGGHVFTIKENLDDPASGPVELNSTPRTISNANRVLLNFTNTNNSAGDYSRVNIKDENGVLQGTVLVQRSIPMIIKKDKLFTLETAGYGGNGLFATSVGVEG